MAGEQRGWSPRGCRIKSLAFLTLSIVSVLSPQGCIPTMARAVVVNAAQLASYSQSKQFLLDSGERDPELNTPCPVQPELPES